MVRKWFHPKTRNWDEERDYYYENDIDDEDDDSDDENLDAGVEPDKGLPVLLLLLLQRVW